MNRIDELQQKYPMFPRQYLVKWEVLNHGIKDSADLDKTCEWSRGGSYQSRDIDVTLKGIAEKRPDTIRPGYVLKTRPLYMKRGIAARVQRDSTSPYEVREGSEGKFALYTGEEKIEDVYFPAPREWGDDLITSKGLPASTLVTVQGRCFSIQPIRFCEFFTRGEQCKFCNYNSTYDDARAIGANAPVTINLEDTVEAYKMISSQVRLIEGRWQSGALRNSEQEAAAHLTFVEKIASATSYVPNTTMSTSPPDRKGLQRLHDAGLTCIHFNAEVWGAELFAEVCPGKEKYRGFERYKDAYQEAVDIYGVGNVACNFVAGVSLMPENGHKTWQESRDALIEGFRWLTKNGAFPRFHGIRLGAGSVYGDDKASRLKAPPTEYFLDLCQAHHNIMMEYGYYEKLNKLMFCPLDCPPTSCCGELGALTLAGDLGKWAAEAGFPEEANWLAKFIASIQTTAEAQ
ncbi:MAG: hypothetical protein Q7O66_17835 [Dehalococcoidia bacterium]|nr:hypothetical protein [Dehalococcoidia bacterium]